MTSETRTLIEVGDVSGIEVECPECHTTIMFPVGDRFSLTTQCPHCNRKWFDGTFDTARAREIFPAVDSLRAIATNLSALNKTRTDIHGTVRLHIKTTPKAQS